VTALFATYTILRLVPLPELINSPEVSGIAVSIIWLRRTELVPLELDNPRSPANPNP